MDDEIVFFEIAEVDLGALGLVASAADGESAGAIISVATKEFGIGKYGDFSCGIDEALGEGTDGKDEGIGFYWGNEIVEAFDFAFVSTKNFHAPTGFAPGF